MIKIEDLGSRFAELCQHNENQLKMIGHGLTATIYQIISGTRQNCDQSTWAIKYFKPCSSKMSIQSEIKISQQFNNPFIVKYICHDEISYQWIAYEKFGDYNLLQYMLLIELSYQHIRYIMAQILEALKHMKSKGYSHRDLKLENILINSQNLQIQICDFGFSSHIDDIHVPRGLGTLGYMAPELFKLEDKMIPTSEIERTDVFSLGVILFALIYRQMPFECQTSQCENWKLINNDSWLSFWLKVQSATKVYSPMELKVLLQRMLAPIPEKRISFEDLTQQF